MRANQFVGLFLCLAFLGMTPSGYAQESGQAKDVATPFKCCMEFRCGNSGPWKLFRGEGSSPEAACSAARDNAMQELQCADLNQRLPGPIGQAYCNYEPPETGMSLIVADGCYVASFTLYPCCGDPVIVDFTAASCQQAICDGMNFVRQLQCNPATRIRCYCYRVSQCGSAPACSACQ